MTVPTIRCPGVFRRGDGNNDGNLDITDGIHLLNFLFLGGPQPPCADAADVNDTGTLDISDGIGTFSFLFIGGIPPFPPSFPDCDVDPTEDALVCPGFDACL